VVQLSDFHDRVNATPLTGFSARERELAFSFLSRMQTNAEAAIQQK
jgi:hypothetical protein